MFKAMKCAGHVPIRSIPALAGILVALLVLAGVLAAGAVAPAAARAAVARGIAEPTLTDLPADPTAQQATVDEIKQLGASYVRIFVSWALAAPATQPTETDPAAFDPNSPYMQNAAAAIQDADADGLKVMVTFYQVPQWASDSRYWPDNVYQPYVVMKNADLAYFGAFCQQFATQFAGQVAAYECWNEPNLTLYLYPQRVSGDSHFAEEHYLSILTAFHSAIKAADPKATIVAGATAPTAEGSNTPPQAFAKWLAQHGAGSLFKVYSHHPYSPGGNRNLAPESQPSFPDITVTLGNLSSLLKIFPHKQFWLTEYGYQTAPCRAFSNQYVSQITQADYLERAYAFVARKYPQVKLLLWYLVKDVPGPAGSPDLGFYTGLETAGGAPKRAWYAFAGHNRLTITAPSSVRSGARVSLSGTLTCVVPTVNVLLELQQHLVGKGWSNVKPLRTSSLGQWLVAGLRPKATTYYRVCWLGVVDSRAVRVRVG